MTNKICLLFQVLFRQSINNDSPNQNVANAIEYSYFISYIFLTNHVQYIKIVAFSKQVFNIQMQLQ